MNITLCDRCGKELAPLDKYTVNLEVGFTELRQLGPFVNDAKYDLCTNCAKIVEEVIKGTIPVEKNQKNRTQESE